MPPASIRAVNFAKAMAKDLANGRRRRTAEQVARIFAAHCSACAFYNRAEGACSECGCPVRPDVVRGQRNKLELDSERCPLDPPAWPWPSIEKRNLLFYILPLYNPANVWRWHVEQLRRYLPLFNGRKIITIATRGPGEPLAIEPARMVREAFGEDADSIEFLERENDRRHWETPAFREMLAAVESRAPAEATFYAHAKGVTRARQGAVRPWCEQMYYHNLGRVDAAMASLEYWPCCGVAKQPRSPIHLDGVEGGGNWHFAGTFFWFRHDALFSRPNWQEIQDHSHAVEAYLSTQFDAAEAHCLAHDNLTQLYDPRSWQKAVDVEPEHSPPDREAFVALLDAVSFPPGTRCKLEDAAVVTAADAAFFVPLELMLSSLLATNDCRAIVVDLGLSPSQVAWCKAWGVELVKPDDEPMPRTADHWQTWNKQAYLLGLRRLANPPRRVIWIDADCIIAGPLEQIARRLDVAPFSHGEFISDARPETIEGAKICRNDPQLYDALPIGPWRIEHTLNAGVVGFDLARDAKLLETWRWCVEQCAKRPAIRDLSSWWDQGAYIWAIENLELKELIVDLPQFNKQDVLRLKEHPLREIAEKVAASDAIIVHCAGRPKPYSWHEPLGIMPREIGLVRKDLELLVLGHDRLQLGKCADAPCVKSVFLPDIDPRNDLAESRVFNSEWIERTTAEFVGLCSQRWDAKYVHCARLETLHELPLSPRIVFAPALTTFGGGPDGAAWLEETARHHPGMEKILAKFCAEQGLHAHGLSLWCNNFIAHRSVALDVQRFWRDSYRSLFEEYGNDPPFDNSRHDAHRKWAYLAERITTVYFANRPDLELKAIER